MRLRKVEGMRLTKVEVMSVHIGQRGLSVAASPCDIDRRHELGKHRACNDILHSGQGQHGADDKRSENAVGRESGKG